jgi:hypothetical protein
MLQAVFLGHTPTRFTPRLTSPLIRRLQRKGQLSNVMEYRLAERGQ